MIRPNSRPDALKTLLDSTPCEEFRDDLITATIDCARALHATGYYRGAVELVDRLREKSGTVLSEAYLRTIGFIRVRALLQLESHSEASTTLDELTQIIECPESPASQEERLLLAGFKGGVLWRVGRWQESIEQLERVRTDLITKPDGLASTICLLELHVALSLGGDEARARAVLREAVVAAVRFGGTYEIAVAHHHLARTERRACRWASAREALETAQTSFKAIGNTRFLRACLRARAIEDWKLGRFPEAEASFESADAEPGDTCFNRDDLYAKLGIALVLLHRGRFTEAERMLDRFVDLFGTSGLSRGDVLVRQYRGVIELERGNPFGALPLLEEARIRAFASCPDGDLLPELTVSIVECEVLLGTPRQLEGELRSAVQQIQARGERYIEAAMYRVVALVHASLGENDKARIAFEQGFALFDEIGTPYEWAKLWMAYGDWLSSERAAAYRNDSAAVEAFRAAMDHFERIGAEYKLGEARQRLEALEERMRSEGEAYAPTTAKVRPARRPRLSAELLRRSQWAHDTFGTVTRNAHLLGMLEEVASVAVSDLPVLVLGESGTGKELVARGVHTLSGRTGEFLAINCSAVPETMLEGEFFGYMRGAFTNAVADKPGLFEVAHEGTVFLDEIGEMSFDLQSKMLRFLETGSLRRVGATRDMRVETRIVAATNRERAGLQNGDGFRSDLYYRLAHAVYELPPLRERGDDIELLLDHFLELFSRQNDRSVRLTPVVRSRLLSHPWPGNVRELRSVVHKLVVSARPEGVITPRELPPLESALAPANFLDGRNADEKKRILRALEKSGFVKADAARSLRMSRTTLIGMMKRLGIEG